MSEIPAVYKAQAAREIRRKMADYFREFDQEKLEEQVVKIYQGCDEAATKTGRYIFPPGIDPIIVYSTPVRITSLEDERSNVVTIGEIIETISRQFAINFGGLKDE